jgi:hypothetical protein
VIEGMEGDDEIVGTPGADLMDSKGAMISILETPMVVMALEIT